MREMTHVKENLEWRDQGVDEEYYKDSFEGRNVWDNGLSLSGSICKHLWTQQRKFEFHKRKGISSITERVPDQKLCCLLLATYATVRSTGSRLDVQGIYSQQNSVYTCSGNHPAFCLVGIAGSSSKIKWPCREPDLHLHLVWTLKMRGAIPPLYHTTSCRNVTLLANVRLGACSATAHPISLSWIWSSGCYLTLVPTHTHTHTHTHQAVST